MPAPSENFLARPISRFAQCVSWALLLGSGSSIVDAQELHFPSCVQRPLAPSIDVVVSGFPGERLYLHPQHPDLCRSGGNECAPAAYVVAGDEIFVGPHCGSWTMALFKGLQTASFGWVAVRRLPEGYDESAASRNIQVDLPAVDPSARSSIAACAEAHAALNESLRLGSGVFDAFSSAVGDGQSVEELPPGVGPEYGTSGGRIADLQIQGQPAKVVQYGIGGSCYSRYLELWTADFITNISAGIGASPADGSGNPTSDALVSLHGEPYFVHFGRDARKISLYGFDKQLTAHQACDLTLGRLVPERIRSATDAQLCAAVRAGKVSGAPIDDIEPFRLTAEALGLGTADGGREFRLVARGRIDVDNDGKPDDVGIVEFNEYSGAGCGHDFHAWWPVKLNAEGMPALGVPFNQQASRLADENSSRLFTFRGAAYFERRSNPSFKGTQGHDVWKFTPAGPVLACVFDPVAYGVTDFTEP